MSAQVVLETVRTARPPDEPGAPLTLLDLVAAVSAIAEGEDDVVRIVVGLLRSGRVRLAGGFRECHLPGRERPDR